jgi:HprK-related kinase A
MKHTTLIAVGPRRFRIGSDWAGLIGEINSLYRAYPKADPGPAHHTVRLESESLIRRYIRPQVAIRGDYTVPDALPLPLAQGLLASEMAMNLQLAMGERRFLLLHAATVERGGQAIILTGESGSGKSTMAALLMTRGWRLMGDEFALLDPVTGMLHPFPRPISLKNESVETLSKVVPEGRFGSWMRGTPKGDIRHLVPDGPSLDRMNEPARPALILFPAFGHEADTRAVGGGEAFVRLTQASTNYTMLGEAGFAALTRLVSSLPALAIDYPDTETGIALVESAWEKAAA